MGKEQLKVEQKDFKKENFRTVVLTIVATIVLILSCIGLSFATLQYASKGIQTNTITTGKLSMTYSEDSEGISITNANPMSDEAGMQLTDVANIDGSYSTRNTFRFSVSSTIVGTGQIGYEITAIKKELETPMLADDDVKLYLAQVLPDGTEITVMEPRNFTGIAEKSQLGSPEGSMILSQGVMSSSQTTNYILKMWVDYDYDPNGIGGSYAVTVNVYGRGL